MNRVTRILEERREAGRGSLMPFFVGGFPVGVPTGDLLLAVQEGGGHIAEVGIPFSDPIADGPVIASAMHTALQAGVTPDAVFDDIARVRDRLSMGVVCMVSASIVARDGDIDAFIRRAVERGVDGFIFPDITLEESAPYRTAAANAGATCSLLIAPTTPDERAAAIANACTGFAYLIARKGITGTSDAMPDIGGRVGALRRATETPIAAGFGIAEPEHIRAVLEHADAAIVGSAIVGKLAGTTPAAACQTVADEVARLAAGMPA
ncbi:MAG: tryptophan synthase subunit alpha [Planctomycetota bacterium]